MKKHANTPPSSGLNRRDALLLTALASAMSLAGCGGGGADGGGNVAGVSSGGTGSFSTGAISGFGSIIVAGVRFDDSKATVRNVDDNTDLRGQLKLGMVVRVRGQAKGTDGISADADSIEVRSELLGPITSIANATTLLVLGQTVTLTATTIFEDGLAGIAALAPGDIVELHGFSEPATNTLTATRVEKKLLANVRAFKVQGAIRSLSTAAQTFSIGTAAPAMLNVNYAGADLGGLALTDGLVVRIQLSTASTTGPRSATRIRAIELEAREVEDADVEGTITSFTSSSQFSVNGLPVNASNVAVPAGLALGVRVDVEGSLVGGVLIATEVKIEDEEDPLKFELHGTISEQNTPQKTFRLAGVLVDYNGTIIFKNGVATDLSNVGSRMIEVKGALSADGTRVLASEISFDR